MLELIKCSIIHSLYSNSNSNCHPEDDCDPSIGWPCSPDDCIPAGPCSPDDWECSPDGTDD